MEDVYTLTEDTTVNPSKTYYSRYERYAKGVIYIYRLATGDWVPQPSGDTITSISISDINNLFNPDINSLIDEISELEVLKKKLEEELGG